MAISAAQMATSECAELQLGHQLQLLNLSHEDHFSKHYFTRSPDSRRFYCLVHPDYKRNADSIREVAKHCVCFRAFGRMAYRQYLRRLKSSPTEERARVILDEIGSYCRKPAAIFTSEHQIDVRARDLLPEDAPPALKKVTLYKEVYDVLLSARKQYPVMAQIIQLTAMLPMSTAECERGFSAMNIVKTKLRNRLETLTLDDLLFIKCNGPSLDDFNCIPAIQSWEEGTPGTRHLKGHASGSGRKASKPKVWLQSIWLTVKIHFLFNFLFN